MISKDFIGKAIPPFTVCVEPRMVTTFAKAIGETNPVFFDTEYAKAQGLANCPAPPTFAFSLNLLNDSPLGYLEDMGVSVGQILHGEQSFEYIRPILVGDTVTLKGRVTDIYHKKGGALTFVILETDCLDERGDLVVRMRSTTVVLNS